MVFVERFDGRVERAASLKLAIEAGPVRAWWMGAGASWGRSRGDVKLDASSVRGTTAEDLRVSIAGRIQRRGTRFAEAFVPRGKVARSLGLRSRRAVAAERVIDESVRRREVARAWHGWALRAR